jgi:hypothetical protein
LKEIQELARERSGGEDAGRWKKILVGRINLGEDI